MSDQSPLPPAGWMYAEGDPPGTHRYWDGSAWQGEPQPAPAPNPVPQSPSAPQNPPAPASPTGGPYGAAPGFDPSGTATAPRTGRPVGKILLGLALAFMLLIGGCSFLFWKAVSGPIDAANDFLAEVSSENYEAAWALSEPSCFEEDGPGQLATLFADTTVEGYSLSSTSTSNGSSGEASGTITFAGGDERTIELRMRKTGDDWLVCGFDIGPKGG